MGIQSIDHVAVPAQDLEGLLAFYRGLGFVVVGEDEWRSGAMPVVSVALGQFKLNLHDAKLWQNPRFTLKGPSALPGCLDLCLVWDGTPEEAEALIAAAGGEVVKGPVERVGGRAGGTATGTSVYTRDPDGNLVELISYE